MNRLTTARRFHPSVFFLVGLLCFCVAMQILGAPESFWDMNDSGDLVKSSLLEECSLPASTSALSVTLYRSFHAPPPPLEHEILLARSLFHPPISHA